MLKFPFYSLRDWDSNYVEDGLVIVRTYYRTYILDDLNIQSDSFAERRVLMLGRKYEHSIYPLRFRCTNIIQINREKRRGVKKFINAAGEIQTYKPSTRVRIEWKKAKCIASHDGQYYWAICKNEPHTFVVKEPYPYIALVTFAGGRHIFDYSYEEPERRIQWKLV